MSRRLCSLIMLVTCLCLAADCLTLGGVGDQDSRRVTRSRYKMGYMFGKRSSLDGKASALLLKSFIRKAISVEELSQDLQTDPVLAQRVARHLDTNGDGYVSVSELL